MGNLLPFRSHSAFEPAKLIAKLSFVVAMPPQDIDDDYQPAGTAANPVRPAGSGSSSLTEAALPGRPGSGLRTADEVCGPPLCAAYSESGNLLLPAANWCPMSAAWIGQMYPEPPPGPSMPPGLSMGPSAGPSMPPGPSAGGDYEMYPEAGPAMPGPAMPGAGGGDMYPDASDMYPDADEMYPEAPPLEEEKDVTAASLVAGGRVTEEDLIAQAEEQARQPTYGGVDTEGGWNPAKYAVQLTKDPNTLPCCLCPCCPCPAVPGGLRQSAAG